MADCRLSSVPATSAPPLTVRPEVAGSSGAAPSFARLEGERLTIRPFREDDITPEYLGWLNDPVLTRHSNQRFTSHTAESSRRFLRSFDDGRNLFLSVRMACSDQAIGTMTAWRDLNHATCDLGILIGDRPQNGQGYGSEAWELISRWLLTEGGTRKLTAGCMASNRRMINVIERSGMHLEATRRRHFIFDGREEDALYFARFAS